jgi:hypothetical protein
MLLSRTFYFLAATGHCHRFVIFKADFLADSNNKKNERADSTIMESALSFFLLKLLADSNICFYIVFMLLSVSFYLYASVAEMEGCDGALWYADGVAVCAVVKVMPFHIDSAVWGHCASLCPCETSTKVGGKNDVSKTWG